MRCASDIAHLIYYVYLCSRKSAYCAGSMANNTLKESDLTFSFEEVDEILFKWVVTAKKQDVRLKRTKNIFKTTLFI